MKEIITSPSGNVSATINGGVLIPSFNNGSASAIQSGTLVTVSCTNDHNMSIWYIHGITNNNNRIYLKFATGSPIKTGLYSNLKIVSSNVFTCVSAISQTVASAVTLLPLGPSSMPISDFAIPIPAKTLKAGSSIRIEAYISMPSPVDWPIDPYSATAMSVTSRAMSFGLGTPTTPFTFSNISTTSPSYRSFLLYCMITFLSDSDYITIINSEVQSENSLSKVVGSSISLNNGFSICPSVSFGTPVTNDYILWNIVRTEIVI